MLRILLNQWDKNKDILRDRLARVNPKSLEYEDLVKITFDVIYNVDNKMGYPYMALDTKLITEIDNGGYQGTLLFLIPFKTYQPSEYEYLMTYVGYGSCSGCDTLLSIIEFTDAPLTTGQISDLMSLCKDIVTNTIKPYNAGWRNNFEFENVDI